MDFSEGEERAGMEPGKGPEGGEAAEPAISSESSDRVGGYPKDPCSKCSQLDIPALMSKKRNLPAGKAADLRLSAAVVQRFLFDADYGIFPGYHECKSCREIFDTFADDSDLPDAVVASRFFEGGLTSDEAETLRSDAKFTVTAQGGPLYLNTSSRFREGTVSFGSFSSKKSKSGSRVRRVNSQPDYAAIRAWLGHCSANHKSCTPSWSETLSKVSLIDVNHKRVVPYPTSEAAEQRRYLALSYVVGGIEAVVLKEGGLLPDKLPHTIADSIIVTKDLGISYLWVDSICIEKSKRDEQISIMHVIYLGAYATIAALDGESGESGLPGVGEHGKRVPQMMADFGLNTVAEIFPCLHDAVSTSAWAERAWTYQEGVLSKRCILFSQHQVYFSCNEMSCSESLDDMKVFGSSIGRVWDPKVESNSALLDIVTPYVDRSSLQTDETQRRKKYFEVVNGYISRKLSFDKDALEAFTGLLQHLRTGIFPDGFLYGLPLLDFRRSLLWCHGRHGWLRGRTARQLPPVGMLAPITPRDRSMFPSWSWVGWKDLPKGDKGSVSEPLSWLSWEKNPIQTPLFVSTRAGKLIYESDGLVSPYIAAEIKDSSDDQIHKIRADPIKYEFKTGGGLSPVVGKKVERCIGAIFHEIKPREHYTQPYEPPQLKDSDEPTFQIFDHSLWITGLVLSIHCKIDPNLLALIADTESAKKLDWLNMKGETKFLLLDNKRLPNLCEEWFLDAGVGAFTTETKVLDFLVADIEVDSGATMKITLLHLGWSNWVERKEVGNIEVNGRSNWVAERKGVGNIEVNVRLVPRFFEVCKPRMRSFWFS